MVATRDEIVVILKQNAGAIHDLGVERVGLFGSFARSEQSPESDVDLLVEFQPGEKSFDRFMNLAFLLEDALGRRVEIVTPESLSPYFGPRILEGVEYVSLSE